MTTQDAGLVEAAARALFRYNVQTQVVYLDFDNLTEENRGKYCDGACAVLTAILPHLSPESQALLQKELNGE